MIEKIKNYFSNFKFNFKGIILYLLFLFFIEVFTFVCIDYGVDLIDRIIMIFSVNLGTGFLIQALKSFVE